MHDWIISDTHFFHTNMIKYQNRPGHHTWLMCDNWWKMVREDQTVLHLGDVLMSNEENWPKIQKLPGIVSVLSTGNHDEEKKKQWMQATWGWEFIPEFTIQYREWDILFSHRPEIILEKTINVHGHIHGYPDPDKYHINVSVERMNYQPVN